jgi:hypothetical protein
LASLENGITKLSKTVIELGPGQSIGVGLAALLSGANNYFGLDLVRICNLGASLRLLDEMLVLFREQAGQLIKGWPAYGPDFPHHILPDQLLRDSLSLRRIEAIASAFRSDSSVTIRYIVPWTDCSIDPGSADVVLTHSVMQYCMAPLNVYAAMYDWLRPGDDFASD